MVGRPLRFHGLLLFGLVWLTAAGCNFVRITLNTPLAPDDVAFIVPGRTTVTEVVEKLGSPDALSESTAGVVATYRFLDMKYSRVNFGWLLKPWSPVDPDLVMSRTGFGTDAFEVWYDANWIVTQHSFLRHVSDLPFLPNPF